MVFIDGIQYKVREDGGMKSKGIKRYPAALPAYLEYINRRS